ncbi:MAG: hypothetical protein LC624_03105 [Halobacteriales archaeon]|nr:hypothetical protein [Halobacteriales archaeon]
MRTAPLLLLGLAIVLAGCTGSSNPPTDQAPADGTGLSATNTTAPAANNTTANANATATALPAAPPEVVYDKSITVAGQAPAAEKFTVSKPHKSITVNFTIDQPTAGSITIALFDPAEKASGGSATLGPAMPGVVEASGSIGPVTSALGDWTLKFDGSQGVGSVKITVTAA